MYYLCIVSERDDSTLLSLNPPDTIVMTFEQKLKELIPAAKSVKIIKWDNTFSMLTIEALDERDFPHNLSDNGMFLRFDIDFTTDSIEFMRGGHVWLSPSDKETEKYKYLAMRGISSLVDKKFRKCKYKNEENALKKISEYANKVYAALTEYTGGYPYKEGIN